MINKQPHKKNPIQKLQSKRRKHLIEMINKCERAKFHYRKSHHDSDPTREELQALTGLTKFQLLEVDRTMKHLARQDQKLEETIEKHTKTVK